LRALAAKHRPDVVELLQAGLLIEPMLNIGANNGGGVLRPQSQRTAIAVFEGIHLFIDDVGFFANAAREQSRLLENRGTNLLIVKTREDAAGGRFHLIPDSARRRQDVAHSFDAVDQACSSL